MDREVNLGSILALGKQIVEHERATIRLKCARNSLLNVSIFLPPEILGEIFRWNVIPGEDFGGLPKDSYNFLLVCHHWFEAASRTPELWGYWGNSIPDWVHRHTRCGTAPLDLMLERDTIHDFDDKLRDPLQDRATRDTIRRVHLRNYPEVLNRVIASIVTKGEEPRLSTVESFIVRNEGHSNVDVSEFFARYRLPKLKCLRLSWCNVSSWDLLKSRTTALTTLELVTGSWSPIPTLTQLFSILSSNPLLQELALCGSSPHVSDSDRFPPQVPLRHLKKFRLSSDFCYASPLLNQLDLPDKMDNLNLSLRECSPSGLSQTLGPYLGDYVRRRGGLPDGGLGLLIIYDIPTFHLCAGDEHNCDDPTGKMWFMTIDMAMSETPGKEEAEKICFDLITHIPREEISDLRTTLPILHSEELCVEMCNLTHLRLVGVDLATFFVEPDARGPHASKDLLPSLDSITIIRPLRSSSDWGPLVHFLTRRAAVGSRISSLRISSLRNREEGADVTQCILPVVDDLGDVDSDEDVSWY